MVTSAVFGWFFKLDKYAMFSLAVTSGLAADFDNIECIVLLYRAQKYRDMGP